MKGGSRAQSARAAAAARSPQGSACSRRDSSRPVKAKAREMPGGGGWGVGVVCVWGGGAAQASVARMCGVCGQHVRRRGRARVAPAPPRPALPLATHHLSTRGQRPWLGSGG